MNTQLLTKNDKIELLNSQLIKKVGSLEEAMKKVERSQRHILDQQITESNNRLAAALGHEINNPLNFILKSAEILKKEYKTERKEVDFILEGAHRINSITNQLNHFLSGAEDLKEQIDLNAIVNESMNLIRDRIDEKTHVVFHLAEDLPLVIGYRIKIYQVLIQVLLNALDFTPERKEIRIETKVLQNKVFICITDNGEGISEEHLDLVFEPFFTTKTVGKGIGLGLYSSLEIVKFHKGSINIYSKINEGTTVEIIIPAK